MAVKFWDVSGTFIIPGTREKTHLDTRRVIAPTIQKASEDLAPLLNEKYAKELIGQGGFSKGSFGKHWAMLNLQWREVNPAAIKPPVSVPIEEAAIQQLQAAQT